MAGPENSQQAKNWLVKSSTKILGPFTREEVMTLLSRRQITIIDEVRQPDGRWNYIRENRYFKEIVKNLRYEQDSSREDTMTSTATIGSLTKTEPAVVPEEFTLTPVTPPKAPPSPQKPALKDVTPLPEEAKKPVIKTNVSTPTKSFGNLADQRVQNKIQKQNTVLRAILFSIIGLALVFGGYTYLRKEKKVDLNYEQLMAAALRYKELGLYTKSLENYKKASAIHEPDIESQFQMAFVLINEDRQSLNGRRILERALLKEGRTREEIIKGHLGMALSYMMEGDLRQAEDYLQKTLGFDANNEAAKVNQAIILMKKGAYAQALRSFEALSKITSPTIAPLVLLSKSMALIELAKTQVDPEALRRGSMEIKTYISKSHFLRKELGLVLIYLSDLMQDSSGQLDAINSFLEEPYSISRNYVRDLSLDWRNTEWDYLERYCADLFKSGKGPHSMKAVRAVCLLESNRDMEAVKFLDESMAEAPKQLSSLQAQAEYLWKLGRVNEARLSLQNSEFNQTRLALYVQGEACLQARDLKCAETAYKTLADRDSVDVIPRYGLAQVALGSNDRAKAQAQIKAGFEAENNYAPLIDLRDQLESP